MLLSSCPSVMACHVQGQLSLVGATLSYGRRPTRRATVSSSRIYHNNNTTTTAISIARSSLGTEEEALWLREEQRWLREEQRWLREELRWSQERSQLVERSESLAAEVDALRIELVDLRRRLKESEKEEEEGESLAQLSADLARLLRSITTPETPIPAPALQNLEYRSSASPLAFREDLPSPTGFAPIRLADLARAPSSPLSYESIESPDKKPSDPEMPQTSSRNNVDLLPISVNGRQKRPLKRGSEGEDVKDLQEALQKLGFYCGSDDMEYSAFSYGTERAVKTWQATIGMVEDGIITPELLARLMGEQSPSSKSNAKAVKKQTEGGSKKETLDGEDATKKVADVASVVNGIQITETYASNSGGVEYSERRVYLLGENRWEDPGRLAPKNGLALKESIEKCFSCKGEGRALCTECEGTGELNVEEQFLEWVEEGARCPYCEGEGSIPCDGCDGKGIRIIV